MAKQFDPVAEAAARDAALDLLRRYRAGLIRRGREIALQIAAEKGEVTSTDVLCRLEDEDAPGLHEVDHRFMGAVFARGWIRVGFTPQGSHCRPVSVWKLRSEPLDL